MSLLYKSPRAMLYMTHLSMNSAFFSDPLLSGMAISEICYLGCTAKEIVWSRRAEQQQINVLRIHIGHL
jgi:hypothetical protein